MTPREAYERLQERFDRISRVRESMQILGWDRATMMPPEGIEARSGQMSALDRHARELLRDPDVESWLERAARDADEWGRWDRANLREMRRMRAIRTAPPRELATEWTEKTVECRSVWRSARPEDDFDRLVPHLETVRSLTVDVADAIADRLGVSRYDALLERHAPGMRSRRVDELFSDIESGLPPILDAALARQGEESAPTMPESDIPPEVQDRAARSLMEAVGFDFDWGRLDTSPHGFCGGSQHDVRVTTRWDPGDYREGIYCVLHETGHAMYNRQQPDEWYRQPVGRARGKTLHESQALLVERFACRTRAFCTFAGPLFAREFGDSRAWEPEQLYRAVTRVEPGLIRVEADEVTYPFHVLLRYRLERQLLSGDLEVDELPEAWDAGMRELLGVDPPDDRNGCMQDIHWMDGMFGYFPTYLLGAMAAAQLFGAAREAIPDLRTRLAEGSFEALMNWLRREVHANGALLETDELIESATGEPLGSAALLEHLEERYDVDGTH